MTRLIVQSKLPVCFAALLSIVFLSGLSTLKLEAQSFNEIQFALKTGGSALPKECSAAANLLGAKSKLLQEIVLKKADEQPLSDNTSKSVKTKLWQSVSAAEMTQIEGVTIEMNCPANSNVKLHWDLASLQVEVSNNGQHGAAMMSDTGSPLKRFTASDGRLKLAVGPIVTGSQTFSNGAYRLEVINQGGAAGDVLGRLIKSWKVNYPLMAKRFNPNTAKKITLKIDPKADGVAATDSKSAMMGFSAKYVNGNPMDSDVMTHEMMHIVQDYTRGNGPPVWASEGVADYARAKFGIFNEQAGWKLPKADCKQKYTDGYGNTAAFFVWLETKKPHFVDDLNRVGREGKYSDGFWAQEFGRGENVGKLWGEYMKASGLSCK